MQASAGQTERSAGRAGVWPPSPPVRIHGAVYTLFALELLAFASILWTWMVYRSTSGGVSGNVADLTWCLIALAAFVWATAYFQFSWNAVKERAWVDARRLLGVSLASGVVGVGILVLCVARTIVADPFYMDLSRHFLPATSAEEEAAPPSAGDAAKGQDWFSMSCASCHGPTGDGMPNNAPSLRESDFRKNSSVDVIAALIRTGRTVDDPANKTGKVMPARGGNPFLEEVKILDLAAFLKNLETQLPASAAPIAEQPAPTAIVEKWALDDFESVATSSDPAAIDQGMQAFVKASCPKCHLAGGQGIELGPSLVDAIKKYRGRELLRQLIEPSSEINEKHQTHHFLLMDGRSVSGVIVDETEAAYEILPNLLEPGTVQQILKTEVDDQVQSRVSAMPTGLLDVLTKPEIADLLSYLEAGGFQLPTDYDPNRLALPAASVQLNQWVVPPPTGAVAGMQWVVTAARKPTFFHESVSQLANRRYDTSISWLFGVCSAGLAFHFIWVIGSASAVMLHQELGLGVQRQLLLMRQAWLFWLTGLAFLCLWFLMFVFIR